MLFVLCFVLMLILVALLLSRFSLKLSQKLPLKAADELFQCPDITIKEPGAVNGNISIYELKCIIWLMQLVNAQYCFEIGTLNGRTTLNLAANLDDKSLVYTLDLPKSELNTLRRLFDVGLISKKETGKFFVDSVEGKRIVQLYGDSCTFDFSPYYKKIDLVFIDGAHSYNNVLSDSLNALKMAKAGSVIIWHDYGVWSGVTKAINKLNKSDPRFANITHIKDTSLVYMIK